MTVLAANKRAHFDYDIKETFEAGLVLAGHEVKAAKTGTVSLKGSFVTLKTMPGKDLPEAFLTNAHIGLYKHAGNITDYEPTRPRKLLLKKSEIRYLIGKKQEQGLTLVPIKMYTKRSFVKIEFGVGRGKKKYDKREDIKKKDTERDIRILTKKTFRNIQ